MTYIRLVAVAILGIGTLSLNADTGNKTHHAHVILKSRIGASSINTTDNVAHATCTVYFDLDSNHKDMSFFMRDFKEIDQLKPGYTPLIVTYSVDDEGIVTITSVSIAPD